MALLSVEKALEIILSHALPINGEKITLRQGLNRVLASDHKAKRTQPPFDSSAMDGYAIKFSDNKRGNCLKIIGQSAAGKGFEGTIHQGECVRIFTGAPVPKGGDTILIQENVQILENDTIIINEQASAKGAYIRPKGLDFEKDSFCLPRNTYLTPEKISLLAAMNYKEIEVRKKPKVAILSLGDELKQPGEPLDQYQIIASNAYGLHSFLQKYGADPIDLGIIPDSLEATTTALQKAYDLRADIIITSGGASVGDHDYVKPSFDQLGIETYFWKIAMRPGKPLMFGKKGKSLFIGLPGNPVSSLVCSHIFLRPVLAKMLANDAIKPEFTAAKLQRRIAANDQREEYMSGIYHLSDEGLSVTPFEKQDSSMLSSAASANCFIHRRAHSNAIPDGADVKIIKL